MHFLKKNWIYVLAVSLPFIFHHYVLSQAEGDIAICTSASGCSTVAASNSVIDASAFCGSSGCSSQDFCNVVNQALASSTFPSGGVVDARGVNAGGSNSCTSVTTPMPYTGISKPSTLILPSGTIVIKSTWVLPDRSRIIGEGNNPSGSTIWGTFIQANGIPAGMPMMQMGNSSCADPGSGQCYGVSISNVTLNGANSGVAIDGIWNLNSGESSYVDHVNFPQVAGTSLVIGGNAAGSSYSNLAMSPGGQCTNTGSAPTACVKLGDANGLPSYTRGIHGLTCTCSGPQMGGIYGVAGILLNSSNNTLEDIHFEGFYDGVRIGSQTSSSQINTSANVLINVNSGGNGLDTMHNVVRICSPTGTGACGNSNNIVSDVTMESISATRSCGTCNLTNVIEDDLTSTNIPFLNQAETSVAEYVLGESVFGGYSRFATSPVTGISTWDVASSIPTVSTACQSGSLFSNTSGVAGGTGGNYTLWVCKGGVWKSINK